MKYALLISKINTSWDLESLNYFVLFPCPASVLIQKDVTELEVLSFDSPTLNVVVLSETFKV